MKRYIIKIEIGGRERETKTEVMEILLITREVMEILKEPQRMKYLVSSKGARNRQFFHLQTGYRT